MSELFVISANDPSQASVGEADRIRIDVIDFIDALKKQWPNVEIESDQTQYIRWRLDPISASGSFGSLSPTIGTVVFTWAPRHVFFEFITWYRRYISENHMLYLFHGSSPQVLELAPETNREDIEDFVNTT